MVKLQVMNRVTTSSSGTKIDRWDLHVGAEDAHGT